MKLLPIYRPIYKEVLPPDTREQYFLTLMLKSQVIECITSSLSWFSNPLPGHAQKQDRTSVLAF